MMNRKESVRVRSGYPVIGLVHRIERLAGLSLFHRVRVHPTQRMTGA
jgi:hypothetical protein